MKSVKLMLCMLGLAVLIQSCGKQEKETASGLKYTLLREGSGEMPKDGEYVVLNMKYGTEDSTWVDTAERFPVVIVKEDSLWKSGEGNLQEIFGTMKEGDSVRFDVTIKDLFEKTWKRPIPEDISPEQVLTFDVGLEESLTKEEYGEFQEKLMAKMQKKQQEEAAKQLEEDAKIIDDYLAKNNIDAQKTESGVYYQILEEGTGPQPEVGDSVSVNYTGYTLEGVYFDSSDKTVAEEHDMVTPGREYGPIKFVLGKSRIIQGWHEGLAVLHEGAKAKLFIPSSLAYGPNGNGEKIKPNAVLAFDVELVDVIKNENN